MKSEDGKIEIYSTGLCYCSVCADNSLTVDEVTEIVNRINPSGVSSDWRPTRDEYFHARSGQDHLKVGCVCESNPNRRHWLLEC